MRPSASSKMRSPTTLRAMRFGHRLVIAVGHTEQYQEAAVDGSHHLAVHAHVGLAHALHERPHAVLVL